MTASDAFAFLRKQQEFLSNPTFWSARRRDEKAEEAAARPMRWIERLRMETGLPRDG